MVIERVFAELEQEVRNIIDAKIDRFSASLAEQLILGVISLLGLFALGLYQFFVYNKFPKSIIKLFNLMKSSEILAALKKYELLRSVCTIQNLSFFSTYHFDIFAKDAAITREKSLINANQESGAQNDSKCLLRSRIKLPKIAVFNKLTLGAIVCFYLLFFLFSALNYVVLHNFSHEFKRGSYFYQKIGNAQIYTSQILIYKEFVYFYYDNVPYLAKTTTKQALTDQIFQNTRHLQEFLNALLTADLGYFKSQSLLELQESVQHQSICSAVLPLQSNLLQDCEEVFSGVMKDGLVQAIQQYIFELRNEYDLTNFSYALRFPKDPIRDHFYLIYYCNEVIELFSERVRESLNSLTSSIITQAVMLQNLFLVLIVICALAFTFLFVKFQLKDISLHRQILFIIDLGCYSLNERLFAKALQILKKYHIAK